ncbi:unnamed protein product [Heterobilharzia americana]|nr:unnamed protein product [Heterobilharzia americana]CAH8560218.1 unnamed protein product [Heterobilharzia americana]
MYRSSQISSSSTSSVITGRPLCKLIFMLPVIVHLNIFHPGEYSQPLIFLLQPCTSLSTFACNKNTSSCTALNP